MIDGLRGLVLISMVLFHAVWDLVFLFGVDWEWYQGDDRQIWRMSIGVSFVLISGFCLSMGKRPLKRGLTVFLCSVVVSAVTFIFMPENRIVFGVLTLLGLSMMIAAVLQRQLERIPPVLGFVCSVVLFVLCLHVDDGIIGIKTWILCEIPSFFYSNAITTLIGFPHAGFFSADYYPLIPWFFLFLAGYFLYRIFEKKNWMHFLKISMPKFLCSIGKNSLVIYMLHQPVIYVVLLAWYRIVLR